MSLRRTIVRLVQGIALAMLGAIACSTEPSAEVVVVADTDLSVPGELDLLRISVTDSAGVRREALADLAASAPRPAILGLVARSRTRALEVVVVGERAGHEVVRRTAHVPFVPGRTVVLRMDLWRRCVDEVCPSEQTCGDAGCRTVEVEPGELTEWSGDVPPAPDGGRISQDAGGAADAQVDAAVSQADADSRDTGARDAETRDGGTPGCTHAADCDDGWTCTADDCVAGRCAHEPSDAACDDGLACTSERCDLREGCVYAADHESCDDGVDCTTDECDRLAGCVSTASHAACTAGSYCNVSEGCTAAPRFADLYTSIIQVRCGPCHLSYTPRAAGLDMGTEAAARASLIGVTATCGSGANTRVIPGDAARSLLWRKVAGVDLCGVRMPRSMTPLDDAQIAQLGLWIDAGAL